MGVQLAPAEQDAINQRPTQNIQAFLAYSRGLVAQDRGDYGAAQAEFNDAANLDPNFRAASQSAASAGELSSASQQTVPQTEQTISKVEQLPAPPTAGLDATQTALNNGTEGTNASSGSQTAATGGGTTASTGQQPNSDKKPTSEILNGNGAAPPTGTVVIIIKRP